MSSTLQLLSARSVYINRLPLDNVPRNLIEQVEWSEWLRLGGRWKKLSDDAFWEKLSNTLEKDLKDSGKSSVSAEGIKGASYNTNIRWKVSDERTEIRMTTPSKEGVVVNAYGNYKVTILVEEYNWRRLALAVNGNSWNSNFWDFTIFPERAARHTSLVRNASFFRGDVVSVKFIGDIPKITLIVEPLSGG